MKSKSRKSSVRRTDPKAALSKLKFSRDIILRTPHWTAAVQFYEKTMGLRVSHRRPSMRGFESGSFCVYVEKGQPHGPVFEFLATDITAAKERLLAAGCVIVEEDPSLPRCYLRDPFGLVFNLGEA